MSFNRCVLVFLGGLMLASMGWAQETIDPNWTGQISAGFTSTRGNSSTDSLSFSASAEKRREKDRTSLGADYANGRQKVPSTGKTATSEDWWRAMGKYDYFFAPKWYGFVNGRYETDKIALLDYRILGGAGLGHQFIENDRTNFSLEAGLAYQMEAFDVPAGVDDGSDQVTAQAGYKLTHQLKETIKLLHDLTYFPSMEEFSDYYLSTSGEIRAHFTENMFSSFKAILNRDSSPASGQGSTDTKFIVSIGWTF
jgi:putative salt-induced outer membrane protein YdiY